MNKKKLTRINRKLVKTEQYCIPGKDSRVSTHCTQMQTVGKGALRTIFYGLYLLTVGRNPQSFPEIQYYSVAKSTKILDGKYWNLVRVILQAPW